jgi:Type I phosphodiesterase / nucleotide pyrophosphatase
MPRICLILIAGFDRSLLVRAGQLPTLSSLPHHTTYQPALPAVTSTAQATLTTGFTPDQHGIICNGLYTHGNPELHKHLDLSNHADARKNVSFWEQSNSLLQVPRFWHVRGYPKKKTAMLFWQNSMPAPDGSNPAADIVLTPKPAHTPDGKTLTACWSNPADLYPTLVSQFGPFPLHNYWSPMAGLPSSQWIVNAAQHVWTTHQPDLQLVYIPHLDFNLLRLGPSNPQILQIRADHATLLIAGDYGMHDVTTPTLPNLALRQAGLLATRPDSQGKLLMDYANSAAFVMADHQIAFLYTKPNRVEDSLRILTALPGLERAYTQKDDLTDIGLATPRAGEAVLLAAPTAWFAHDYWESDAEKPLWQFTVDIHNKPGFDPRELFFDPAKKCIAQNPLLVKGSHALIDDPSCWPVLLSDHPLPDITKATQLAPHLATLLQS